MQHFADMKHTIRFLDLRNDNSRHGGSFSGQSNVGFSTDPSAQGPTSPVMEFYQFIHMFSVDMSNLTYWQE